MQKNIPMTVEGEKKIRKELEFLKMIRRPMIIKEISKARSHGDLKENAEYQSAKEEQSFCEGRIQELEFKLLHAYVIDVKKIVNKNRIVFGSTVKIMQMESKKKFTYKIVGDDEANFKKKLISINSPMSRGLIGKKKKDIAIIETPLGCVEYKILKIEYI